MKNYFMAAMIAMFIVAGCSHSPVPNAKNFKKNEQKLFQAAHHWEVLAKQQAENIMIVASGRGEIFLSSEEHNSPFGKAFYDLIIRKLVSIGATVVTQQTINSIVVSYKVQVISHNEQGRAVNDLSDVSDSFHGREAREQKIEVLITTSGKKEDRIIMSNSQLYYIYPDNVSNYQKKPKKPYRVFIVTDN